MSTCVKCGKSLHDDAKFCANCGAVVGAPPQQPPAGFAPPPPASAAPAGASAALVKGLIERVTAILLRPASEWPVIAAEASTSREIYLRYVAPLVAIGVIATFIGNVFIGITVPLFGTIRVGFVAGLSHAVLTFVLTFVGVFLISLLIDVLAPTFGGQRDAMRALKVTAYSYTPAWVAGVLHLIPSLGILVLLAALYGLYLLYLGLPVLMRCPQEKALGYTAVVVVCAIVMSIVIGALSAAVFGGLGMGIAGASMHSRSAAEEKAAAADTAASVLSQMLGGKTEADRTRMRDALQTLAKAGREAEKAAKAPASGNPAAVDPAAVDPAATLGAVGTLMAGGAQVEAGRLSQAEGSAARHTAGHDARRSLGPEWRGDRHQGLQCQRDVHRGEWRNHHDRYRRHRVIDRPRRAGGEIRSGNGEGDRRRL